MNKILDKNIQKTKILTIFIICLFFMFLFIRFPQSLLTGGRKGLAICGETIIPTMFPFLVFSSFLIKSGIISLIGKKTDKIFKSLFRFSGIGGSVYLISLIGGYPVGTKMIAGLLEENKISTSQAQRLALCCVNAGPAFVISTVGGVMLKSTRLGLILFASVTCSSIFMALLTRFIDENCDEPLKKTNKVNYTEAFVFSVSDSANAILMICAWIVLFSCLTQFIPQNTSTMSKTAIEAITEVTLGCLSGSKTGNFPLIAGIIGWGGLCVHCQIMKYILKIKIKKTLFFASRIIHSALSAVTCHALLYFFPCDVTVFSNVTEMLSPSMSVNIWAGLGMLMMCVILIFDVDSRKKVC